MSLAPFLMFMKHIYLLAALFYCFCSFAGEDRIVGDNRDRLHFEFYIHSGETTTDTNNEALPQSFKLRLVVTKYVPKPSGGITLKSVNEYMPVACHLAGEWSAQTLRCDASAPYGFASAEYEKNSKGKFRCIKNCNRKIPSILVVEAVENGC